MMTPTHCCHLLAALLLMLLQTSHAAGLDFDVSPLGGEIRRTCREALGFDKLQAAYDKFSTYTPVQTNWTSVLKEKADEVSHVFTEFNNAVIRLKNKLESTHSLNTTNVNRCCDNAVPLKDDPEFQTAVNLQHACTRQDEDIQGHIDLPGEEFLEQARYNADQCSVLKWQYVGTEEGGITIYPAHYCGCDFKPRTRPWYVETSAPEPKDIIILMDAVANEILIQAAITIVSSSNPNDRIGIVVFGGETRTPGDKSHGCYGTQLALGTPQNKKTFQDYLTNLKPKQQNEASKYWDAILEGFKLLQQTTETPENRTKVMLFFTASNPTESIPRKIPDRVRDINQDTKHVAILTYSAGDIHEETKEILEAMANQTAFIRKNGYKKKGRYQHLYNTSNLRFQLGSYFDAVSDPLDEPLHVLPYVDNWGLGLIISICMPFFIPPNRLRGVVCVDGTVGDLLPGLSLGNTGQETYYFLIDKRGRTILHPLLVPANEKREENLYIDISLLEREAEAQDIIASMKRGESGSATFVARRPKQRKVAQNQWVSTHQVNLYYHWQQVPGTSYSLCLVSTQNEYRVKVKVSQDFTSTTSNLRQRCLNQQTTASSDFSSVTLGEPAVACPQSSQEVIKRTTVFDSHKIPDKACPGVKDDIELTAQADSIWRSDDSKKYNHATYWRYLATTRGVLRTYPAANVNYNITDLPWYGKAIADSDLIIINRQNHLTTSSVTLSKVIYEGRPDAVHTNSDFKVAVVAAEFHPGYFLSLLRKTMPACVKEDFTCFLVDESGEMILHPKLASNKKHAHILSLEPEIAAFLQSRLRLTNGTCINFETVKVQRYWRLSLPGGILNNMAHSPPFRMQVVFGTNTFVAIKPKSDLQPKLQIDNLDSVEEFNVCNYTLSQRGLYRPTCPLIVDTPMRMAENITVNYDPCFNPICQTAGNEQSCNSLEGCSWCHTRDGAKCGLVEVCEIEPPDDKAGTIAAIVIVVVLLLGLAVYICYRLKLHGNKDAKAAPMEPAPPPPPPSGEHVIILPLTTGIATHEERPYDTIRGSIYPVLKARSSSVSPPSSSMCSQPESPAVTSSSSGHNSTSIGSRVATPVTSVPLKKPPPVGDASKPANGVPGTPTTSLPRSYTSSTSPSPIQHVPLPPPPPLPRSQAPPIPAPPPPVSTSPIPPNTQTKHAAPPPPIPRPRSKPQITQTLRQMSTQPDLSPNHPSSASLASASSAPGRQEHYDNPGNDYLTLEGEGPYGNGAAEVLQTTPMNDVRAHPGREVFKNLPMDVFPQHRELESRTPSTEEGTPHPDEHGPLYTNKEALPKTEAPNYDPNSLDITHYFSPRQSPEGGYEATTSPQRTPPKQQTSAHLLPRYSQLLPSDVSTDARDTEPRQTVQGGFVTEPQQTDGESSVTDLKQTVQESSATELKHTVEGSSATELKQPVEGSSASEPRQTAEGSSISESRQTIQESYIPDAVQTVEESSITEPKVLHSGPGE